MPSPFLGPIAYLALAPACICLTQGSRIDSSGEVHGVNPLYIDRSVNPITDFYAFSNGRWLAQMQIPQDQPAVSATALARQRNEEMMWRLVIAAAVDQSAAAGTPEQLVGQFVRTGLNLQQAERQGYLPIKPELDRIAGIQTKSDLMAEFARLHRWFIDAGFRPHVDFDFANSSRKILGLGQAGLTLGSRDAYLKNDSKARNLRVRLTHCIRESLQLVGDSPESSSKEADRILDIETKIAAVWKPASEVGGIEANYHPVKNSELGVLTPKLNWARYFEVLGAPTTEIVNVEQPAFLTAFGGLVQQFTISDWESYLKWRLIASASAYLSADFVQRIFELNSALTGQERMRKREEFVLEEADLCLGNELGRLLARTDFGIGSKSKVLSMVQMIRGAIRDKINGLDWMASTTKAKALEKLDRMKVSVCYPDHWRDSSKLIISDDSFAKNVFRAREFEFQRRLDSMAKPVDAADWDLRAYAVDARYDPSTNAIVLPAGVLQAPYFDAKADDAFNYGSFGTLVGHEMMHAFDARGRKFDADGNLRNWWTDADGVHYEAAQKAIESQYNGYLGVDSLFVNGKLTLEENVADLGGLTASLEAFKHCPSYSGAKSSDGFTPEQRFFLAFGQMFRSKVRPEFERLGLTSDPHSPPKYRVKGVLQNVPEFWKAFNGVPPKTLLHVW